VPYTPLQIFGPTTSVTSTTTTAETGFAAPGTTVPGCPSDRPAADVTKFSSTQQEPGSDTYVVDVEGTVVNNTSAAIDLSSVTFVVLQGTNQVGGDTVPAGRTVPSKSTVQWWSRGFLVKSPDGVPNDAQVTALSYAWNDPNLSGCAR
jgi:hypothetical protein